MNHDQVVEQLLELMKESDLDELRVRFGETSFELVRREAQPVTYAAPMASAVAVAPGAPAPSASAQAGGQPATASASTAPPGTQAVKAPLVGVFYSAPSPGAEPFVQEGTRVQPGQVLCILEAMKMMNEITAEVAGTVTKIGPKNGELVKVDEVLFWIAP